MAINIEWAKRMCIRNCRGGW